MAESNDLKNVKYVALILIVIVPVSLGTVIRNPVFFICMREHS